MNRNFVRQVKSAHRVAIGGPWLARSRHSPVLAGLLALGLLAAIVTLTPAAGSMAMAGTTLTQALYPQSPELTVTPTSTPIPVQCGTDINFAYAVGYPVGDDPVSVIVADFNSDGRADLATANSGGYSVSVLLGNGNGTFQPAIDSQLSDDAGDVAAGDFNSDGHIDLAGASGNGALVFMLLGNGDGTFGPPAYYSVDQMTWSLAVGDLNNDGKLDVVAGLETGLGGVAVLLGNGNGTLQPAVQYQAGHAMDIALADVNGDTKLDIATADWQDYDVSVLLGNGNGTFGQPAYFTLDVIPRSLTVADFNGDNHPDIVTADNGINLTAAVLLGVGDGTFQPAVYYPLDRDVLSVASGDFNGDGYLDLVAAGWSYVHGDGVTVLRGLGDGTFAQPLHFLTLGSPYSVAVGELNGDGRLDVVAASDSAGNVSVLLNRCGGTPTPTPATSRTLTPTSTPTVAPGSCEQIDFVPAVTYTVGQSPRSVASSDFNMDGHPDIATANNYDASLSVMLNNGDGTLAPPSDFYIGSFLVSVAVGDFNEDTYPDLAAGYSQGFAVMLNNGDGNFHAGSSGYSGQALAVGDVNGDGHLDLVTADDYANQLRVVLGNGDGTFGYSNDFPVGSQPDWVALGDFNEDGHLDAATANSATPGGVSVLLGNGDGTFQAAITYAAEAASAAVVTADFDEDGHLDLAASRPWTGDVAILLGNGNGGFDPPVLYAAGFPHALALGDFNSDGHLDLAGAVFMGSPVVNVLRGNGDGSFGPAQSFEVGVNPTGVAVSDLNGDGQQDLSVAGQAYNTLSVLMNACVPLPATPTHTSATVTGTPTPTPTLANGPTSTSIPATNTAAATPTNTTSVTPTTMATGTATPCAVHFTDVPVGSTFYPYVTCLACRGILGGYPDNTFRPNNNVTRGQLAKIVSNAAGFSDQQATQMFQDVPVGSTFFQYIGRLASRGYMSGYPCGGAGEPCGPGSLPYFRPNANATRGQISKIVSNAAGFSDPPGAQRFQDVPPGSTFYDYIQRLASRSIMSGYPCGGAGEPCGPGSLPYFRPNRNATRGQVSKIVSNTFFPGCQSFRPTK